jgi:hypothetical protein
VICFVTIMEEMMEQTGENGFIMLMKPRSQL